MPFVFDIETNGLIDEVTKLHCLSYHNLGDETSGSLNSPEEIKVFLQEADVLIGHNIILYDIPVLEKLLGVEIKATLVDTLALSWYLEPDRKRHGLEEWGEEFGIPKPVIEDWNNLSNDEYIHRCSEDVKINTALWRRFKRKLTNLYGDWNEAKRLIEYLSFKMDCIRQQEHDGWKLDVDYAQKSLESLLQRKQEKLAALLAAMPKKPVYALRKRPMKPFKKDGTYSTAGARWFAILKERNLPLDYAEEVKELVGEEEPNPSSVSQVKDWLFSLGWKPATFKIIRDKNDGSIKKIPQINGEHGQGLCPSVRRLVDTYPAVDNLDELGVISHRIGLLNGFLRDCDKAGYVRASISGFTNTLRMIHKTVVNLPKVNQKWGEEIRGSLIAPDGYELCGSDQSSLEDRLKQHYIYPYDPEYVQEMNKDDYDPHLSLALLAKEVTDLEVEEYKSGVNKKIKPIRDIFKNGNYACQYGAQPERLSLTANISLKKAKQVFEAYWEKNWAIKEVAKNQKVKKLNGEMWLFNPVSKFWYSLRHEKDIFSTLVQGTAAYVFDRWLFIVRSKRKQLTAQFHDELVLCIRIGFREKAKELLQWSIVELNKELNLNRELGIDIQFGSRYSEIH